MTTRAPLLIDLAGVARLADVRRPVASVWRTRFADSADPFPPAVREKGGRSMFDAIAVAQWLERTSHGNNPDAVADSAAAAAPADFDVADAAHLSVLDALLTLRAVSGEAVSDSTPAELGRRAAEVDPHNACLLSELAESRAAWAQWADLLADAAYSPLAAARLLERRHGATRSADGSAGPFTSGAEDLLITTAHALAAEHECELVLSAGVAPALAARMVRMRDDLDLGMAASPERRDLCRRLLCEGIAPPAADQAEHPDRPGREGGGSRMRVERLPATGARSVAEMLRALDEVALGMRERDRAMVIAPASVLTDPLSATDAGARADVLRSGRVRAIVKLPAGMVQSAPREAVAIWILGREAADLPVADRFTAVADLTGAPLTPATRADLVSDIMAAMGRARDVRAHAFRFTRLVRTSSLIAARGPLVQQQAANRADEPAARDLPALLDASRAELGDDAPAHVLLTETAPTVPTATVQALIAERHLRVLAGTRLSPDELGDTGLVVVGADDLENIAAIGTTRIDPFAFAEVHPSAQLTAPGDVVFRTAPTPRAWVDADGSTVVAYPARVLRIDPDDPGGLVPVLVVADIERSAGGAGSWRRWALRRVSPLARGPLGAALAGVAAQRNALARRIDELDAYSGLLAAAVVSGRVSITDDTADDAAAANADNAANTQSAADPVSHPL